MTVTRKREQEQGAAWLHGMLDVLKGGVLGVGVSMLALMVAACLVWFGVLGLGQGNSATIAACILGGFIGGLFAVKRKRIAPLPEGLSVGIVMFLFLLTIGVLLLHVLPTLRVGGAEAGACLCGGGLAGVLGRGGVKKRRKR